MKKYFYLSTFLIFLQFNAQALDLKFTVEDLDHPESVLITQNAIYISEMGIDTGEVIQDGDIQKRNLFGKVDQKFKVNTPLTSPMGMGISRNHLYIADVDKIVILSATTGEFINQINMSHFKVNFLNDIEIISNRYLIITATNLKKVFCYDLVQDIFLDLNIDLKGNAPNGVTFDTVHKELYISANEAHTLGNDGNGKVLVYNIDFKNLDSKLIRSTSLGRFLDGIEIQNQSVILSDWFSREKEGKLYSLNKKTLQTNNHDLLLNIGGFADFDFNQKTKFLAAPALTENKVYIYESI